MSNANPYSHVTYNTQDVRLNNPTYNATMAHYAYTYDTYIGNSSYLEMQLSKNYQETSGRNKVGRCAARSQCPLHLALLDVCVMLDSARPPPQYGWYPYPSNNAWPYICEKPQILYACNQAIPPPAPAVPLCLPHDNDTGGAGRAARHAVAACSPAPAAQQACDSPIDASIDSSAARTRSLLPQPDAGQQLLLLLQRNGGLCGRQGAVPEPLQRLPGQLRQRARAAHDRDALPGERGKLVPARQSKALT